MEFKDFISSIKKVKGKRKTKINDSYGIVDYYKYYTQQKKENKVTTIRQFSDIIESINKEFCNNLLRGESVIFPYRIGRLDVEKTKTIYKIASDGTRLNSHLIDWNSTLKLWYEDEEARQNKFKVFNSDKYKYRIKFTFGRFNNAPSFNFVTNRKLLLQVVQLLKEQKIDAYEYENYIRQ